MAGWRLFQNLRFRRVRRHLSTGSQPSLGQTAPSDYRPEAGCVVIGFGTIIMRSLRVRLIGAGIYFFVLSDPEYSVQVDLFCRKGDGFRFLSENLRAIWRFKFAGPGQVDPIFAEHTKFCVAAARAPYPVLQKEGAHSNPAHLSCNSYQSMCHLVLDCRYSRILRL